MTSVELPLDRKLSAFARDIKLSHSIFAMPWAVFATFLAARGWPMFGQLALIVLCMVTARTVAMAANRLLDAKLDAQNPRTAKRAIPSGMLSPFFVAMMLTVCALGFIVATSLFWFIYKNPWPVIFSLPVLAFVSAYPLLKRFTRLCHYYLGASLALAPVCAWVAIRGGIAPPPLFMAAAVLTWTAGFDIIYACQDFTSDVEQGIFSVPSKIGIGPALWVSRFTHLICIGFMLLIGWSAAPILGGFFYTGVIIAILLIVIEHSLVGEKDLSKVGIAFFTVNGIISVLIGLLGIVDVLRHAA